MKLGISTLYLMGKPFKHVLRAMESLDSVELWEVVDEYPHKLTPDRVKKVRELSKNVGFSLSLHAPFLDVNIASLRPSNRRRCLHEYLSTIEKAHEVEAEAVVIHPGQWSGLGVFYPGLDWRLNLEAIASLGDEAGARGLSLAVENMPPGASCMLVTVDEFLRIFRELGSSRVGVALDVGHANLVGEVERFLDVLAHRITHLHLHDNFGDEDSHLGIERGGVGWGRIWSFLSEGFGGVAVVESIHDVVESYLLVRRRLKSERG